MSAKRLFSLILAAALLFTLAACAKDDPGQAEDPIGPASDTVSPQPSGSDAPAPSDTVPPSDSPSPSASPEVPDSPATRLAFLNGPTGVGAAKLLADIDGGAAAGDYTYEVVTDNSQIVGMLSGPDPEVDIAAIATNVALNLYNKTGGKIQIAALNTLGVLYVLEKDRETIHSMADLAGKTLYATGQGANPQYVLDYLLDQNGLDPERDLTIHWVTAEEVSQAFLSGEADAVLLPVPAATAALAKSEGTGRVALDLTQEWDALGTGSTLTMGCVVVRTQFAQERPEAVAQFLTEYAASIDFVASDPEAAAALVADHGLAPSEPIAKKAIPDCHLVCITGADIQPSIDGYYTVLYQADPAAIGGSLPDDGFYYVP